MTSRQLELAQGAMTPVGGRRIGVVNVGEEDGRAWATIMVVGGPSQVDARIDAGVSHRLEGYGDITLLGIAEPADLARRRGPVIAVEIDVDGDAPAGDV